MKNKVLFLRTADKNGKSYGGFQWPTRAPKRGKIVECSDWDSEAECGHGLHGLLWGCGGAGYLSEDDDALWYVCEADADLVIDLENAIKVPRCRVVYVGDRDTAIKYLDEHGAADKPVVFSTRVAGYYGGEVSTGAYGTAIGKYRSLVTAGRCGKSTTGYSGTAISGHYGTSTAGCSGTAIAGNYGKAQAGATGTAIAGYYGIATAGDFGTAITGYQGKAKAGYKGVILIDKVFGRIGENGLNPDTFYKVSDGKFVIV